MTVFQGTVAAVDSQGRPSVQLGPLTAVAAASGVTPTVGDLVWVLMDGTSVSWLPGPQPAPTNPGQGGGSGGTTDPGGSGGSGGTGGSTPPADGVYWGGTTNLADTSAWPDRVLMPAPLAIPSGAVPIPAGANINSYAQGNPAGTVFALAAGTYTGPYVVYPKAGQQFYGAGAGVTITNNVWWTNPDSSATGVGIFNMTIANCSGKSPVGYYYSAIETNGRGARPGASGWHVANCELTGSYTGFGLGDRSLIEHSTVHHNQAHGIMGGGAGSVVRYNQFYANFTSAAVDTGPGDNGGIKMALMTGATWTGNLIHKANPAGISYGGIGGPGLWMDVSCGLTGDHVSASPASGNTFTGNLIYSNYGSGICDETGGNNTFVGNLIAGNGKGARLDPWRAAGLVIQSSNHDSATGNYLWGNPASVTIYLDQNGGDRSDARRSMFNTITGNWCDVAPGQLTGTWSGGSGNNTISGNTVTAGLAGVTIPKVKAGPQTLA